MAEPQTNLVPDRSAVSDAASSKSAPLRAVRSMTGFASVRQSTSAGELNVSLRAVNHRGLDLHFHSGHEFAPFENEVRAILKRSLARAHVEIRMSLARERDLPTRAYDRELLAQYVGWFEQAAQEFKLTSRPDLNVLFTLPGIWNGRPEVEALPAAFSSELFATLEQCVTELNAYREREGGALRADLESQAQSIEQSVAAIGKLQAELQPYLRRRLQERWSELLAESGLSETRLAEEAAILADKADIQEELTRLRVHAGELERILSGGGEIGKKLDFLLQEMNRETNTTLAKSTGAGEIGLAITNLGIGIKANIERIREQALNLE